MFFVFSKLFIFLTDPLFYILLLTFLGVLRFKKRKIPVLIFVFMYLISVPFVSQRMMYFLEHLEKSNFSNHIKYDAVVVLTGMVNISTSTESSIEFSGAVDRILKGIELIKKNKAKYLIISGGTGRLFQTEQSEARILDGFSKNLGIEDQAILLDTTSRNTYQNAVNTLEIVKKYDLKKIVLVTSAFHMYRSNGCFRSVGITADLLPVDFNTSLSIRDFRDFIPSTGALYETSIFLHEMIGIIMYGISGKAKYF